MRRCNTVAALLLAIFSLTLAAAPASHAQSISPSARATEDATRVAQDAYLYFYPLITLDLLRRQAVHPGSAKPPGNGSANTFVHERNLAGLDSNQVTRPQIDMLTTSAWVDLTAGPVVLSVPDSQGRDYSQTLRDMWSDAFAVVGKRTTGHIQGHYVLVPPGWTGTLPSGMPRLDTAGVQVWINGLVQVNGATDLTGARALQDGFSIKPLAQWNQSAQSTQIRTDPTLDLRTPVREQVESMPTDAYFTYAAELLRKHPPQQRDQPMLVKLRRVGIVPGRQWDFDKLDHATKQGLRRGMRAGRERLEFATVPPSVRGWQASDPASSSHGTAYLRRALAVQNNPVATLPEDQMSFLAAADVQNETLDAGRRYLLRFEAGQAPLAAIWSLTLYDAQGHLPASPEERHFIGSSRPLRYQPDGALEILIQADPPESPEQANWLAAPAGVFTLSLRLYTPQPAAVDGRWTPPALYRTDLPVTEPTEVIPPGTD